MGGGRHRGAGRSGAGRSQCGVGVGGVVQQCRREQAAMRLASARRVGLAATKQHRNERDCTSREAMEANKNTRKKMKPDGVWITGKNG